MARNYFKAVAEWENAYVVKHTYTASELQKNVIIRLRDYIISGVYSNSKVAVFFGKYYNKSYSQLVVLWKREFGTVKSEDTLRGQRGALSRQLVDMFGSIDSIDAALKKASKVDDKITEDDRKEAETLLKELLTKINALEQVDEVTGNVSFAVDIQKFIDLSEPAKQFDISECTAEIKLLKALSTKGIQELLGEVSTKKLGYVLKILDQPLMQTETREYTKNGKDRVSYFKNVNIEKVKLLEEFEVVTPAKLRAPKNSKVKKEVSSVEAVPEIAEKIEPVVPVVTNSGVETAEELPFRFATMNELCVVIQEKLQSFSCTDDDAKRARNISNLKQLFSFFTEEGLRSFLMKYAGGDVAQALKNYEKG
ncbi:MAG: hypothetical protein K2M91_02140 [Lachnospiraceae bacterium]|nr:hypothetical protein [Lachnospiraceae bacterium]